MIISNMSWAKEQPVQDDNTGLIQKGSNTRRNQKPIKNECCNIVCDQKLTWKGGMITEYENRDDKIRDSAIMSISSNLLYIAM